MKYALISEEQIAEIIATLDTLSGLRHVHLLRSMTILQSLKPSEPVAFGWAFNGEIIEASVSPSELHTIPLIALDTMKS